MTATEQGAGRDSPESRGEAARERATELQQRRADLAAGLPSNAETAPGQPVPWLRARHEARLSWPNAVRIEVPTRIA